MTGAPLDPDAAAAAKGEAEEQARVQRNLGWHLLWRTLLEQKRALVLGVAIGIERLAAGAAIRGDDPHHVEQCRPAVCCDRNPGAHRLALGGRGFGSAAVHQRCIAKVL
ncbi:MAG: hypothetical protein EB104_06370 [Acidimicrobiia bacterium]|nr:hypothetical protein [Acidimicrobiia bacterium]